MSKDKPPQDKTGKDKPPTDRPTTDKMGKDAAGDLDGAADGVEVQAKKKPPLMVLIAAGAGAVLVLGGGGVGAAVMLGGHGAHAHKAHKKPAAPAKGKDGKGADANPISEGPDGVVFYTMPDMIVNIQSPDGRPTFLKLKLAFELPDEDSAEAIQPNQLRLNDMFQSFLRELRPEDLSGSEGSYELRQEIQRRVNLVIAPSKVNAVLIQEMLIQ